MDADAKAMVKEKIPERDRADAAGGEEMKRKRTRLITISQKKPVTGSQRGDGKQNVFSVSLVTTWINADQKCS